MRKALKIILIIFIVLVAVIGVLAWWQWDNLMALKMAMTYDTQEIAEQMRAQDQALKQEIQTYFPGGIRDFTEAEIAQIEKGEYTEKQMLAKVISEAATAPTTETPATASTKSDAQIQAEKEQEIISRYVSQLYTLEGEYIGKIEGLISSALSEYKQKRDGKNNRSLQLSIGAAYTGKLTALEGECDGRVDTLLASMQKELDAIGADKTILSTIRNAYASEKTTKRAYYMSKYGIN